MRALRILFGITVFVICLMAGNIMAQNLLVNPESIVYDSVGDRYLASNFGDGAIVQIDSEGNQDYFNTDFLTYYNMVGLHIKDGSLYAAANGAYAGVKVFDLATGVMTGSFDIPEAFFLNDVTSDTSGYVYTTDFEANKIYRLRISDYHVSTFLSTGAMIPNGILFDARNNRLLVSLNSPSLDILAAVNLTDSTLTTVVNLGVPVDGVTEDDERNIYVSSWSTDAIYRFDPSFTKPRVTLLTGFTDPADIFFNKKHSLMAVPNFNANRVDLVPMDVGVFTRERALEPANDGASHGISWADIDGDGYPDMYVTNGLHPDGQVNGLFQNDGSAGFAAVSTGVIVTDIGVSHTSTWGDCDNDGDLDVFVANGPDQADRLYLNDGGGTFTPVTEGPMVTDIGDCRAAGWGDYDNDGNVDLFVATTGVNSLFKNTGTAFVKITDAAMTTAADEANGVCWGDYTNDGYGDLFVARSNNENNALYTNNGDGTFTPVTGAAIVEDGGGSCGGSWGDYDNDGDLDLFVPNMSDQNNFLYNNQGDGTFVAVTTGAIVNDGGCSYGSAWGDYDNDGDLDLFVGNTIEGVSSGQDFLYNNNGDGSFTRVSDCEIVDEIEDSYGAAWGDYDIDGDLDLFVARSAGGAEADNGFYRNNGNANNWLSVRCIGAASNGAAIGTKVRIRAVIAGDPVWQMREISAQTGLGGQNSLDIHFGLGDATVIDSMKIEWPTGISQALTDVGVNQILEVTDYLCGDANADQAINVGDAVFLINYTFKGGPPPEPTEAGDANCDYAVNVGDAVYLINYAFKGGPEPCANCL